MEIRRSSRPNPPRKRERDSFRPLGRSRFRSHRRLQHLPSLQPIVSRIFASYATTSPLPDRFVLDGELIVVDRETRRVKPFHSVSVLLGKSEKPLDSTWGSETSET